MISWRMKFYARCIGMVIGLLMSGAAAMASVVYVDDDASAGGDGQTWETAYRYVQDALYVSTNGDEIRIAGGVYRPDEADNVAVTPGDRNATFALVNGVCVYGGYAGYGAGNPDLRDVDSNASILSGDLVGNDQPGFINNEENSYHVVMADDSITDTGNTILDGFTITAGNANTNGYPRNHGAGVCCVGGAPTLSNCTISSNSVFGTCSNGGGVLCDGDARLIECTIAGNSALGLYGYGGGLYGRANATIKNCTITDNRATYGGGGVCFVESDARILDSVIAGNTADDGGGVCCRWGSPTITGCTVTGNMASGSHHGNGGGIACGHSNPTITDCTISVNMAHGNGNPSAGYGGGGIGCIDSSPIIAGCTISGNTTRAWAGGGIFCHEESNPIITNCAISGNIASQRGGAVSCSQDSSPTITNCTVSGNTAAYGGGIWCQESNPTLANCILWGDAPQELEVGSGSPVVTYCNFQGGWSNDDCPPEAPICNINFDPRFVRPPNPGPDGTWGGLDDDYGDVRLRYGSPCIDAGDNDLVPPDIVDMDDDGDTAELTPLDLGGDNRFTDDPDTDDTGNVGSSVLPVVDLGAFEGPNQAFVINPNPVSVPECGTTGFLVALAGPPEVDINVNVNFLSGDDDISVERGETLLLTAGNYADGQQVTLGAKEDIDLTEGTAVFRVEGGGLISFVIAREIEGSLGPVLFVDGSMAGSGTGGSWADALNDLEEALSLAADAPGAVSEIRVAGGTYRPSARTDSGDCRTATFSLINGVAIRGGYRGCPGGDCLGGDPDERNLAAYESVLSGDINTLGVASDNSYHVVVADGSIDDTANTVLDGFTITEGNANGGPHEDDRGGGVACSGGSPTITHCRVVGNAASQSGGGVCCADGSGAAIVNCVIVGNTAGFIGGGIWFWQSDSCVLGCTIVGNDAPFGGAIVDEESNLTVTNSILWDNGPVELLVLPNTIAPLDSPPLVSHCNVQGSWPGDGNMAVDPLFVCPPDPGPDGKWDGVNDNLGDLHLACGSPCLDSGTNETEPVLPEYDIDGYARVVDGLVDIGAYEGPSQAILVLRDSVDVPENGSAEISIALACDPGMEVEVIVQHDCGDSDITVGPVSTLGFDSSNYADWRAVPLSARDDGDSIEGTARISMEGDSAGLRFLRAHEVENDIGPILYVDSSIQMAGNGSSWAEAFVDLQVALDMAASAPGAVEQVWLAAGTYYPSIESEPGVPRSATFQLIDGVSIYGGFAGHEAALNDRDVTVNKTTLSGDLGCDDATGGDNSENSFHVVMASGVPSTVALDGVTITGGNADAFDSLEMVGGGMLVLLNSDPLISNCCFVGNSAVYGAGMGNFLRSSPTLVNCVFNTNTVDEESGYAGGGLASGYGCSPLLTDCSFIGNSAPSGGGVYNAEDSHPRFANCTFELNQATGSDGYGGGVCNRLGCKPVFTRCTFTSNSAGSGGGGAIDNQQDCTASLSSCKLLRNTAITGGAVFNSDADLVLVDCTFDSNGATEGGGGYCSIEESSVAISRCVFRNNSAGESGGGLYHGDPETRGTLTDCVFEGNTATRGGGICNQDSTAELRIVSCKFQQNLATSSGGGVRNSSSDSMLTNCLFIGNRADGHGGGLFGYESNSSIANCVFAGNSSENGGGLFATANSSLALGNCTFTGNLAVDGGAIRLDFSDPAITNSILWKNMATDGPQLRLHSSTPVLRFSDIEGSGGSDSWNWLPDMDGGGNIDQPPKFIFTGYWDNNATPSDPADDVWVNGHYRLRVESPCIDSGSVPVDVETDLDGHARVLCGEVDMGAYELGLGDSDCDRDVDLDDFSELVACLSGPSTSNGLLCVAFDSDSDGDVDLRDFAAFQEEFAGWAYRQQGDFDGDDDVDAEDYMAFANCLSGPSALPSPSAPTTVAECLMSFDFDVDSDVDLADFMRFQDVLAVQPADCNSNGVPDTCDIDCGPSGGPCDVDSCGLIEDCQTNGIPDDCDIAYGISLDANGNGIPDECERLPGDYDDDGDVDLDDYAEFPNCLTGAQNGPYDPGCEVFDFDADQDVDLADFMAFQEALTVRGR